MYSDVFRMYPRARVGKPSDTIKIQHARCEYKRILAHEGSMTLRYKVPYTIQARYKQDTVEYRCIPDVATGYSQDTSKIQSNTDVSQMYPARQSSTARGRALTLGRRLVLVILLLLDHLHLIPMRSRSSLSSWFSEVSAIARCSLVSWVVSVYSDEEEERLLALGKQGQ